MNRAWTLLLLLAVGRPLAAQGPGFQLGHLFTGPDATSYRIGASAQLIQPVGTELHAVVLSGQVPFGTLWGLGADLSLFRSGSPGVYLIGGLEGGVASRGSGTLWGSWSAGLGYELIPIRGFSVSAEGRYHRISDRGHGIEIGLRLGLDRGSRRGSDAGASDPRRLATSAPTNDAAPDTEAIRSDLSHRGVPEDRASLISGVVQTALDVMGMPYRWGDEGDEGFDCSGLIRYSFGKHGITLPRRSADQAREGAEVARDLDQLRAGDVLTFATNGGGISHVGLYLGNGKFIHSASQGVQISVLSPDDVTGRWWFKRWVGARRIIG
ncbi:MAG TPA: C40 family peptidase [Gemmatimonadales bacterium]|nr:C40 family peptidase [Gemmatimonadales bacterium]